MTPLVPAQFPRGDLATKTASATVQVVFAYKNSPTDWEFQRLPLHGDLQDHFRRRAELAAEDLRDSRTGRAYDPEWDLKADEFFYLSNDPPVGGNFFTQLPNFVSFPAFQERRRIKKPNAWVVIAQLDDESLAYFGARITRSSILDRTSKVLRIVYREDAFDSLDHTVVTFRPGFDWIVWQDILIVLHGGNFHAMFRDVPALVAKVDEHLQTVVQHVGIDNLSDFADRIKSNPVMMVKLQRIIERADMHTRPIADLRTYAQDYSIDIDWNGDRLVFDGSVEKQWNILRLLDEARTLGPVTGKHWDTSSKTEV
jgi:Kiwa protein KwaB-like